MLVKLKWRLKMEKIINYNCDGLCVHRYCGSRYTHMTVRKINGIEIVLGFCLKHAEEFEKGKLLNQ